MIIIQSNHHHLAFLPRSIAYKVYCTHCLIIYSNAPNALLFFLAPVFLPLLVIFKSKLNYLPIVKVILIFPLISLPHYLNFSLIILLIIILISLLAFIIILILAILIIRILTILIITTLQFLLLLINDCFQVFRFHKD